MKFLRRAAIGAFFVAFCFLSSCNGRPDADSLVRGAKEEINSIKSCVASSSRDLTFSVDGKQHSLQSQTDLVYAVNPFALKSVQTSRNDGTPEKSESYTVAENGGLTFYCKTPSGWQKTAAGNLDSSPSAQIEALQLLNDSQNQKYAGDTMIGSQRVHKIELKLKSDVLRSAVESIVTQSGMGGGSKTIVQTLLNDLYGSCYIGAESKKPVRFELDATDVLNRIFQNIDGSSVSITVSKYVVRGDLSSLGSAPPVTLPAEAKSASSVQAEG